MFGGIILFVIDQKYLLFFCQAIEQLNIKTKSFKDLLTDETYKRSDLITLQDPTNLAKFNLANFHHLKNNLRVETEGK